MPITLFQQEVLRLLAAHRDPGNYVAGGMAIHRLPNSARCSNDADFFHDLEQSAASSFDKDAALLEAQDYTVKVLINQPSFAG